MSHTIDPLGFIQSPFHFQQKTDNPNNLYTVDIVDDPNVTAYNNINSAQIELGTNKPFYTFSIRPKDYNQLICAGDFTIDGLSSSWVYNTDYIVPGSNPNLLYGYNISSPCYPPAPPWYGSGVNQHLRHSTPHSYIIKGAGTNNCWGPGSSSGQDFVGNGTYRFNGPFVFDNSAYCDGDFLTSPKPITWRKIILVDMYQLQPPLALYLNAMFTPDQEPDLEKWVIATPNDFAPNPLGTPILQPAHNGFPAFVRAFVFPEVHPVNLLEPNNLIDIDIDLVAPVNGCTDQSANNYDATANRNDGTCIYPPPPTYSITISDGGGTGGLYTSEYDNNTFGSGVTAPDRNLVFNNDGSDVVLATTYAAGDIVNETINIDLTPQLDENGDITVFDFTIAGGPDPNITQTLGYSNQGDQWDDAKNNLTGASIRIQNTGNPGIIRVSSLAGIPQDFSNWHNSPDPTAYQPEKTTVFEVNPGNGNFTAKVITTDSSGNNLDVTTGTTGASTHGGISIVEHYYPVGDPAITAQPALAYFPYKLELIIEIKEFVMPAEDVNIAMIIDHNTENQGDPNWTIPNPISGCTNPIALNYDPAATDDDGSCILPIYGCTVPQATNYDPLANVDDGSCTYPTGSKILCTTIYESTGLTDWEEKGRLWNRHLNKHLTKYHQIGYHTLFYQFTLLMKKYKPIFKLGKYMTVQRSKDLEAVMNNEQRYLPGMIIRYIFEPICYVVGLIKSKI